MKEKAPSTLDITYCANLGCPIKSCERHPDILKTFRHHGLLPGTMVSIADYSGSCREYISWLIENGEAME